MRLLNGYCSNQMLWIPHTMSQAINSAVATDLRRIMPHATIRTKANGPASQYSKTNPKIRIKSSAMDDPVWIFVNARTNKVVSIMATANEKRIFSSPIAPR